MKHIMYYCACSVLFSAFAFAAGAKKSSEPLRVGGGERINLPDYLVAGMTTIVEFKSDHCPPCRALEPYIAGVHAMRDVAVVVVDIDRPGMQTIDWGSPMAKQFGIRAVPHFKIYKPDGTLAAEDGPESYAGSVEFGMFTNAWVKALSPEKRNELMKGAKHSRSK